jgi:hypothetical protein
VVPSARRWCARCALTERSPCLAVPAARPLARSDSVDVADLHGQRWIAGPVAGEEG